MNPQQAHNTLMRVTGAPWSCQEDMVDELTALRHDVQEIADLMARKMDDGADRQYVCEDALWRLDRALGETMPRGARVWDIRP